MVRLFPLLLVLVIGAAAIPPAAWAQDDDDSASPAAPAAAPAAAPTVVDPALPPAPIVRLPPPPAPVDPEVLWARASQQQIPAWTARAESALARAEGGRRYFAGELPIEAAFPSIAGGAHGSPAWVAGALVPLQAREEARIAERIGSAPSFADDTRVARWGAARAAALDAEELADGLERRLLLGFRSAQRDHPALAGVDLERRRGALATEARALEASWATMDEGPDRDAKAVLVAQLHAEGERLATLARETRRWSTVPGAPPPSPLPELEQLAREGPDPRREAAIDRLLRLRPVLIGPVAREVDQALFASLEQILIPAAQARLVATRAPQVPSGAPPLAASVLADLRAAAARSKAFADSELQSAPVTDDPIDQLWRYLLEVRAQTAGARVDQLLALAEAADRHRPVAEAEAAAAAERAESARRDASIAAGEAHDARSRKVATILKHVATAEADSQAAWDHVNALAAELADAAEAGATDLAALRIEALEVRELAPGLRRSRAAEAWSALHDLLTRLRKEAVSAGARWSQAQGDRGELGRALAPRYTELEAGRAFGRTQPPSEAADRLDAAITAWTAALGSLEGSADEHVRLTGAHRAEVLDTLQQAKRLREGLRRDVPRDVLARDRDVLFEDLQLELSLVVPNLSSIAERRLRSLTNLPGLMQQLDRLWSVLVRSFWLVVAVIGWIWGRRRIRQLIPAIVTRLGESRRRVFGRELQGLHEPIARVTLAAVDLVATSAFLGPVRARAPEIALLLVLYRLVALYRLLDGVFRLAVAPRSARRPALLTLAEDAWTVSLRAIRGLVVWVILGTFVQYLCRDLLGADALAQVLSGMFAAALAALSLVVLFQAEPLLRRGLGPIPDSRVKAWLERPPTNPFASRAVRALVSLCLLTGVRLWQIAQGNIDESSSLGSILNVVNRRFLTRRVDAELEDPPALPAAVLEAIASEGLDEEAAGLYPTLDAAFDEALADWQEESTRGVVLLVADRGQGRDAWADRATARGAADSDLPLRRLRLETRLLEEGQVVGLVAERWGLPSCGSVDELAAALLELPPSLLLVEQIEFAFLRRVGGFSGLRALFRMVTATSSHHFWVLTAHAPTWRLLDRIGTVANPNSFRAVLEIPRLTSAELAVFVGIRTANAGFVADFDGLLASSTSERTAAERERTAETFFRLLAEASGGNPGVALPMWTSALSPSPESDRVDPTVARAEGAPLARLVVRLPDALVAPQLPALSDAALLTLAAIRVHGRLDSQEITEANNTGADLVLSTVQVLEGLGLLRRDDGRYRIALEHVTAVTRLLRRRHFVYGKDSA